MDPRQSAKEGIARTFEHVRLFNKMTVDDNILAGRIPRRRSTLLQRVLRRELARREERDDRRKVDQMIEFFELRDVQSSPAGELALWLQARVGLARALVAEPDLLLLDEPMMGLNPAERGRMSRFIRDANERFGTAIVLAEHDEQIALELSDRVVVLSHGQKLAEGAAAEIRATTVVSDAYRDATKRGT